MAKRKQLKQGNEGRKAKAAKNVVDEEENEANDVPSTTKNQDESGSDDGEASSEPESSDKEEENDGLADMMSKILNQNTGSKVPVLAKRKTALMKDIEAVHKDGSDLKKLRAERRIERNKQNAVPDASSADYERQLKKLATRGVVALFNAIAKAKRDTVAAEEEAAAKKKAVVGAATVSLGSAKDDGSVISRVSAKSSGKASTKAGEAGDTAEGKPRQWAALRDDYMVGEKLTVKHWDKAVESDSD